MFVAAAAAAGGLGTPAVAGASTGGATATFSAADKAKLLVVRKISCVQGCRTIGAARAGSTLRFQGPKLTQGKRVVYLGGSGADDDVRAQLRFKRSGRTKLVTAVVPKRASSGPVAIELDENARSAASASSITLPARAKPAVAMTPLVGNGPFFPIRGSFTFGAGVAAFGGTRGHQGEDVFATCGTPLVAAEGGRVSFKAFQSRAGNYVVIDVAGADRDEAYMHLKAPSTAKVGDVVAAGQPIGEVGDTGRADGCHLHFELWQGSWQSVGGGGAPIDPLPTLKAWAALPVTR